MQIVYISNRKGISGETLRYVENLMPFIHEAVFICPPLQVDEFRFESPLKITVVDETEVLGEWNQPFRRTSDHQLKNWLLRASLAYAEVIDDEFIMSDDDARPLEEISLDFFKASGRYNSYYFYDLKEWTSRTTDYDRGQHLTRQALERESLPTKSYSAHMPQIINKTILGRVVEAFKDLPLQGVPIDEWSTYFNYGQTHFPEKFSPPQPFKTLCWPMLPSDWDYFVRPEGFVFENFCPYLYRKRRIFGDIPTGFIPGSHHYFTAEKVRRKAVLQNVYEAGKLSFPGKIFIFLRKGLETFPRIRRSLNTLLPPGLQTEMLDFFLRTGFQGDPEKNRNRGAQRANHKSRINGKIRVLVNAVPMAHLNTGIGRYLRSLYTEMERLYGDRLKIGYFDGFKVSETMPQGPANLNRWIRKVDLFWYLPVYPAVMARVLAHVTRQALFRQYSSQFEIYHEAGFFPFAAPNSLKTVFTVCDLSLILFPQNHPRERVLYSRMFFERRCGRADHFLTISDYIAGEMEAVLNIVPEKLTVTPLAHDSALFSPRPREEIRDFRMRYRLPEKYFLFVGSGDPRKNLDVIPQAIDLAGLDIPLVVAGWSGWSDEQSNRNLIPLGYVSDEDLPRAYSGALGLIFPSSYEGFGLPIVEAMACGCPVVTTKEASLPQVAGDAAIYLGKPRSRDELAHLLAKLAKDEALRAELSRKGRIQAEKFSWEKTARATFEVFLAVMGR